jgi:hypothetical protein
MRLLDPEVNLGVNNDEMNGISTHQMHSTHKSFSDLFKVNDNKTLTEPLHNIINLLSYNDEEKRKREFNVIIFGLKVSKDDKSYITIKKFLKDLGVNENHVHSVSYLKKKDVINEFAPIKLTASDIDSKFFILKAAKKLKDYNIKNLSTISITLDMSEIDRQLHKKLVVQRKTLNSQLKSDENFYYGIRNNSIIKIKKFIKL